MKKKYFKNKILIEDADSDKVARDFLSGVLSGGRGKESGKEEKRENTQSKDEYSNPFGGAVRPEPDSSPPPPPTSPSLYPLGSSGGESAQLQILPEPSAAPVINQDPRLTYQYGDAGIPRILPEPPEESVKSGEYSSKPGEKCVFSSKYKECKDTIGSKCAGDNVRDVQLRLISLGYKLPKYGADCKYLNETRKAVLQFQKDKNIKPTGVVDKETMAKLKELTATRAQQPIVAPSQATVPLAPPKEEGFFEKVKKSLGLEENIRKRNKDLEKLVFERLVKGCK